jgi:hypothetical protein
MYRGEKEKKEKPEDKTEISEIDAPPVSNELKSAGLTYSNLKQTRLFVSITGTWVNVHRSLLP